MWSFAAKSGRILILTSSLWAAPSALASDELSKCSADLQKRAQQAADEVKRFCLGEPAEEKEQLSKEGQKRVKAIEKEEKQAKESMSAGKKDVEAKNTKSASKEVTTSKKHETNVIGHRKSGCKSAHQRLAKLKSEIKSKEKKECKEQFASHEEEYRVALKMADDAEKKLNKQYTAAKQGLAQSYASQNSMSFAPRNNSAGSPSTTPSVAHPSSSPTRAAPSSGGSAGGAAAPSGASGGEGGGSAGTAPQTGGFADGSGRTGGEMIGDSQAGASGSSSKGGMDQMMQALAMAQMMGQQNESLLQQQYDLEDAIMAQQQDPLESMQRSSFGDRRGRLAALSPTDIESAFSGGAGGPEAVSRKKGPGGRGSRAGGGGGSGPRLETNGSRGDNSQFGSPIADAPKNIEYGSGGGGGGYGFGRFLRDEPEEKAASMNLPKFEPPESGVRKPANFGPVIPIQDDPTFTSDRQGSIFNKLNRAYQNLSISWQNDPL